MESMSPREFFEMTLPSRFKPEKAAGIDVVVQVDIAGPNGGNWTVTVKDQRLSVAEGIHPAPKVSLKMAEKDYMDLMNHKISPEKAFFTGKLQLKGDIGLALKLRDMGFF